MRNRVGSATAAFLLSVASFFDVVQALLNAVFIGVVVNVLIDVIAWLTFYLWLKLLGVGLLDPGIKKAATLWGGMLFELVPLLNTLPVWTASMALVVAIVKMEDRAHNKKVQELRAEELERSGAAFPDGRTA